MGYQTSAISKSEASPLLSNNRHGEGVSSPNTDDEECNTIYTAATGIPATLYVISGVTQPLLVTICKSAGLADPNCQLYMLFYYLGPASVGLKMCVSAHESIPSNAMMARAGGITLFDICAQAMNYNGAALAGPTIFAIIYSSVTVWTAVFSRLLLGRKLVPGQWLGIITVFCGLAITATDNSVQVGSSVLHGLILVIIGSMMHGLTYVLCEIVMVVPDETLAVMPTWWQRLIGDKNEVRMSVTQNCAIQGIFAVAFMLVWQIFYTVPHMEELILEPMNEAGTSLSQASIILGSFALANLIHALSYFFTLRHFPGGATSAGVMKGLQAVLVFVVTDYFFCGRTGGREMCFTPTKLTSLVTVVGGVALFGIFTEQHHRIKQGNLQSEAAEQTLSV